MQDTGWDDLKLFFHVAVEGGLSGAAQRTGLSAPTIGRRMLALERATGRALFVRSQQGYRLAPDGHTLLDRVRAMRKAYDDIAGWRTQAFSLPIVSVASDAWLSRYVAAHAMQIRQNEDQFRLCCKRAWPGLDLTFREADVVITDKRPTSGNLAVRPSVTVAHAAYRAANQLAREDLPWISVGTESAETPAHRHVFENHEAEILTWTTGPDLLPPLIAGGAGRGVLPCFVGDRDANLARDGEIIESLSHKLYIVTNDDDRHRPEMRLVIERLAALMKRDENLFAGKESGIKP
jgi:DNA-binding transcriptional LysR family regulator